LILPWFDIGRVVVVNGQPVYARDKVDTTGLPPFGEVQIQTRFRDFPGWRVSRCHILLHEDLAMMGTVKTLV
jgi:FtsP/CotA-like multicopper oxidase with cupredoxin domain